MTRIVWTHQAIEDVEAIRSFIARDSPHYASLTAERIVSSVDRLQDFPLSGRVVSEVGDAAVREVIVGNYRLVYRLLSDTAEVLTVFHGARLFPNVDKPTR